MLLVNVTMARQVGTAGGIAPLGSVYLGSIEKGWAQLPGQAGDAGALAAMRLFETAGGGLLGSATNALVVSGFVQIALATAALCVLATTAALFIRHRAPAERADTTKPPTGTKSVGFPNLEVAAGLKGG